MGTRSRNLAIVVALAALGLALAASASPTPPRVADARKNAVPVDVELVIAVDVSYSMDPDEQALQREGYILALTSKEFLQALRQGAHGKIAITYFEWAGQSDQKVIMPWRLIDGPESADAVAAEISRAPYRRASRTSISGALQFAKPLFDDSGYKGLRRVIDVSGDGTNNAGQLIVPTRDDVLASGITINGLPIMILVGGRFRGCIALALLRHDVDKDWTCLGIAYVTQHRQQVVEVVTVDRTDVVKAKLFEQCAAGPEASRELLRASRLLSEEFRQVLRQLLADVTQRPIGLA